MNLIRRHKNLALIGSLTLILIIILFFICARMLFSTGETQYGQRLNGLVKIDKEITESIITETKENSSVEDIKIRTQGKIIYITITYKKGTKVDKAKEIATKTLEKYNDEIIGYYDFAYFIKENVKEGETSSFVLAGTKHPNTEKISWTKQ